jgi:hypothetical protein
MISAHQKIKEDWDREMKLLKKIIENKDLELSNHKKILELQSKEMLDVDQNTPVPHTAKSYVEIRKPSWQNK